MSVLAGERRRERLSWRGQLCWYIILLEHQLSRRRFRNFFDILNSQQEKLGRYSPRTHPLPGLQSPLDKRVFVEFALRIIEFLPLRRNV